MKQSAENRIQNGHKITGLIQLGLEVLFKEGPSVFFYKLGGYLNRKDQYTLWIQQNEKNTSFVSPLEYQPKISVVVPVYNVEDELLKACIESVCKQTYQNWELCLVDDCSTQESVRTVLKRYENNERIKIHYRKDNGHISRATNSGFEIATGEFIGLLDCDDLLTENALYEVAKLLNKNPEYDFIYTDEDKLSEDGKERKHPFFKPDWSPDTFMSIMYTCHFSVFRKTLVEKLGGMRIGVEGAQDYDFVLRVAEVTDKIGHIPKILYHWRERKGSTADAIGAKPYILEATVKSKEDALARRGLRGYLEYMPDIAQYRVVYELQKDVKISIVILSKDNFDIYKTCVDSIKANTDYKNYEIITVDNGSEKSAMEKYQALADENGWKYIYQPQDFNFSAGCNIGAKHASGEILLFLNDDIEIPADSREWLQRMAAHAMVPQTGVVGCKLKYPNTNKLQHAGVLNLEIGPGHALHGFDDNLNYYYGRNLLNYNFSIITGACFMIETEKFNRVGGFDESFPVSYNDVELCFRFIKAGLYNVLRNEISLIHHESISRGYDVDEKKAKRLKEEAARLYEKHPDMKGYDPCYNPNLVQTRGDYSFRLSDSNEIHEVKKQRFVFSPARESKFLYNVDNIDIRDTITIRGWCCSRVGRSGQRAYIALMDKDGICYTTKASKDYRPDVRGVRALCSAFCGYTANFRTQDIPFGTYQIVIIKGNTPIRTYREIEIDGESEFTVL